MKKWVIILLFIIAILLAMVFTNNDAYLKTDKLYINEVVAKNSTIIQDDYGEYSDYIELYNGYDTDINLEGYHLSDREFDIKKWTFPKITIKAKSYLLVFASGRDKCNLETNICHTSFKASSTGEKLTLTEPNGNIISKVSFDKVERDISYSYDGRKYVYSSKATPNAKNEIEEVKTVANNTVKDTKVIITEYMKHNKDIIYISDGGYYDFIELYNSGDKDVNLSGLYLSDNPNKLNKFALPDMELKSKEYLAVYLTGGVKVDGYVCANFGLSDLDENIYLSNGEKIFEELKLVELGDNVSYGLKNDKWYYFISPTPGKANNTRAFEKMP